MLHEISTLRARMEAGGDWRGFRDEIADLHARASTEEEYVTLMEDFTALVGYAEQEFAPDVFERLVREHAPDGTVSPGRIDLYKRNSFVLEAKQSRQQGGKKEIPGQAHLFPEDKTAGLGRPAASRAWDALRPAPRTTRLRTCCSWRVPGHLPGPATG